MLIVLWLSRYHDIIIAMLLNYSVRLVHESTKRIVQKLIRVNNNFAYMFSLLRFEGRQLNNSRLIEYVY